jgi:hypothetical protein
MATTITIGDNIDKLRDLLNVLGSFHGDIKLAPITVRYECDLIGGSRLIIEPSRISPSDTGTSIPSESAKA